MRDKSAIGILGFAFFNPHRLMYEVLLCCLRSSVGRILKINKLTAQPVKDALSNTVDLIQKKSIAKSLIA